MTLNEYQQRAARTINQSLTNMETRLHALHLIASEVGEIHALFQKAYQGHKLDPEKVKDECGDLLWGICELLGTYGISLEDCATANDEKLQRRYPSGFDADRSVHRPEYQH